MKLILEIDGGGIKGIIPAEICAEIEGYLRKPLYNVFDLISGTSTGAILGSQLAAGVPAQVCRDLYVKRGPEVFKPRSKWNPLNWGKEKYDRNLVLNALSDSLEKNSEVKTRTPLMNQLKTKFMCTSVSIVDEQNHYFKSWEEKDGKIPLLDAVARSFAAAYYFGAINDPANQQVWADGGEGLDNCTARSCLIEAIMQDWIKDGVYILSIGCGYVKAGRPYAQAAKMGWVGESKFYINLARRQSVADQTFEIQQLQKKLQQSVIIDRLDVEIPAEWDELDAVGHIKDFSSLVLRALPVRISDVTTKIKQYKPLQS
jgi:uncharacterized protein